MKPHQLFSHWEQVRSDLLATFERFSEAELSFSPFKDSWPVGQTVLHIADCEDNWIHGVVRGEIRPWIFYNFSEYPTRATILEILNRAHRKTIDFLNNLDEKDLEMNYQDPDGQTYNLYWILWHVVEHEIHHRGELSLIHGLLGRQGLDV